MSQNKGDVFHNHLSTFLQNQLKHMKITKPTPVQVESIPRIFEV